MYQVGMSVCGYRNIPRQLAIAVSERLGGSGKVQLVDNGKLWNLWMIDIPEPFTGQVDVGEYRVDVETPLP